MVSPFWEASFLALVVDCSAALAACIAPARQIHVAEARAACMHGRGFSAIFEITNQNAVIFGGNYAH